LDADLGTDLPLFDRNRVRATFVNGEQVY